MSSAPKRKIIRPTALALLGAAALVSSIAESAERTRSAHLAPAAQTITSVTGQVASAEATTCDAPPAASLRSIIEQRAEKAERAGRWQDVDELTTLWLTLERRQQLDRVVERGEQFVNVSLRNQKRSEQRSETRELRRAGAEGAELELPTFSFDVGQALDAESFVASLEEPYRSAVMWSLHGMNHREVAEQMGASHAAVRKWAQRLRDRLEQDGWELDTATG